MQSAFGARKRRTASSAGQFTDETYDLGGLNLVAPDQIMPGGRTGNLANTRRFADQDNETSVAQRTRKGSIKLSTPIGETANAANSATVTGDIALVPDTQIAIPFTASAGGVLTKLTLGLKKALNTRGYLIVEVWSRSNSLPATKIAQSSIAPNLITTSYANVTAYFIDAPTISNATTYFIVIRMRELGVGTYYVSKTAGTGVLASTDAGATWSLPAAYSATFTTYLSTAGSILGFSKRYPEVAGKRTIFGFGTGLYQMPDSPAVPALVESYINASATYIRFANVDEWTFYCDGFGNGRRWDGTAAPSDIVGIPTANGVPINLLVHQNRLMSVPKNDPTRIDFSALFDWTTWPSVNFMYIGRPNSPDSITAWCQFQQGVTVFTKESKYSLLGTDITTFTPTPHAGTKGAVSQEAIAVGKSVVYFLSDDHHIYQWNGTDDRDISLGIVPELKKILDMGKVRLHLYNNQLRVYYNRNPDPSVTYMLLYDIANDDWYKDTGRPVAGSMEWLYDNHELIEFSSRCGWLFTGESGYSDLGKEIEWKYWTNYKNYAYRQRSGRIIGGSATKKHIRRFRPVVRPANSEYYLSVGRDFDFANEPVMRPWLVDSSGTKWGTFNWGDGTKYGSSKIVNNVSPMSGRGRLVQYRFEHGVIDDPVELYGYIAIVRLGKPT